MGRVRMAPRELAPRRSPPLFFFFGVGLKQIASASDVAASPAGAVTNQKEEERARAGKAAVH